jgi:hypothetical protein
MATPCTLEPLPSNDRPLLCCLKSRFGPLIICWLPAAYDLKRSVVGTDSDWEAAPVRPGRPLRSDGTCNTLLWNDPAELGYLRMGYDWDTAPFLFLHAIATKTR